MHSLSDIMTFMSAERFFETTDIVFDSPEIREKMIWVKIDDVTPELFQAVVYTYQSIFDNQVTAQFDQLEKLRDIKGKGFLEWEFPESIFEVRRLIREDKTYLRFKAHVPKKEEEDGSINLPTPKEKYFQNRVDQIFKERKVGISLRQIYSVYQTTGIQDNLVA